ncbi:MAG: hypothetical protein A2751_03880 [Candidatus Doudnabacteria bacterium RIFCSPHIGHO2_01_FULL_46_14]|uniref:Uncharacterized protein n=1 Tax=Candidatus Doudnabacteria bacterium RIFCSPHIGHO2_01_FULL_46_14 TaxID=1817824 RepID=A0A1F5NL62_9BACT|nr:MAG: hypothetical protein A2751_03880 [Candidatus Doudnabacteria bacterium RIFCSPHIGHO2_01_FULL_46_14]
MENKQFGFVYPPEFQAHWNALECTIENATDGTFVIVDHSLNGAEIYIGRDRKECADWLRNPVGAY